MDKFRPSKLVYRISGEREDWLKNLTSSHKISPLLLEWRGFKCLQRCFMLMETALVLSLSLSPISCVVMLDLNRASNYNPGWDKLLLQVSKLKCCIKVRAKRHQVQKSWVLLPWWNLCILRSGNCRRNVEKSKGSFKRFSPHSKNIFWHIFARNLVICCPIYNSHVSLTSRLLRSRKASVIWIELYITVWFPTLAMIYYKSIAAWVSQDILQERKLNKFPYLYERHFC